MAGSLNITLTKSPIGKKKNHRRIVKALGLTRMHQTVCLSDSPVVRGMVNKISHMVRVEEDFDEAS